MNIKVSGNYFKKWNTMRISSTDEEAIVIRIKEEHGGVKLTMFPYAEQENKFTQWVWWKLLKMLVFLRII